MPDRIEVSKKVPRKPSPEELLKLARTVMNPTKAGLKVVTGALKKPAGSVVRAAKLGLRSLKGAVGKKPAKKEA